MNLDSNYPGTATVLLVEDNLADQEMTRRAMERVDVPVRLVVVDDGDQALDYLQHRDIYQDPAESPRPDLVLLDINLPKMSGRDVLRRLREDENLAGVPVVILSTSQHEDDVRACYRLGCSAYMTKPLRFEAFLEAMQKTTDYWFRLTVLPRDLP